MKFRLFRILTVIVSFFFLTGFVPILSLIGPGEAAGNFREIEIQNGKMVDVNYR